MSDIAIVGIGEVPTARMPERTNWDIIYDTCIEAVEDSGIGKDQIQGVVSVAPVGQPVISGELAFGLLPERLGLKGVRDSAMVNAGGASTSNALRLAEQWIASGIADSVLVQQVTVFSTMPVAEQIDVFARAGIDMQWEYPYGTTYNIIMGLMATRYMYESGASPEEMASVVTALRSWAEHDPHSLFYGRPAPSVDQVLGSDMLNTPLHKRESNVLADGGAALVVVSARRARELGGPRVQAGRVRALLQRNLRRTRLRRDGRGLAGHRRGSDGSRRSDSRGHRPVERVPRLSTGTPPDGGEPRGCATGRRGSVLRQGPDVVRR